MNDPRKIDYYVRDRDAREGPVMTLDDDDIAAISAAINDPVDDYPIRRRYVRQHLAPGLGTMGTLACLTLIWFLAAGLLPAMHDLISVVSLMVATFAGSFVCVRRLRNLRKARELGR